jgi:TolA-binding protein
MSRKLKLVLYAVCIVGVIVLGSLTLRSYREASRSSELRKERIAQLESAEPTNAAVLTNAAAEVTNAVTDTNLLANVDTNVTTTNAAATNVMAATKDGDTAQSIELAGTSTRGYTRMITYGLALLLFFITLAVLIAYDVSHFFAHKAEQALFNDDGAPVSAEYEQAEELAKDGKYLEAIQAMRDYLKENPREQYVALRIAEIYEQNLYNYLAAALEYEEVLKKKLPPERWGWAAIHLANLYSGKLNQPDKAIVYLRRIDAEYGQTAAARKARERLTQIDPTFVPASVAEVAAVEEAAASEQPASNLPPGFRPKT